jgi:hypothetical protein
MSRPRSTPLAEATSSNETTTTPRRSSRSSTAAMSLLLGSARPAEIKAEVSEAVRPEQKRNYNTRSREPSISENPLQSHHKKIMYLLSAGEVKQIEAAESWVVFGYKPSQPNQREIIINDNNDSTRILAKVKPEDTLYIHSHMYTSTNRVGGYIELKSKSKGVEKEEKTYSPEELAEHLEKKGLNKDHKKLKLFCCYGDVIAQDLYAALVQRGYNQIELSSYRGETTLISRDIHKAAGLTVEEAQKIQGTYKDKDGKAQFFRHDEVIGEAHRANSDINRVKITPESYRISLDEQPRSNSFRP